MEMYYIIFSKMETVINKNAGTCQRRMGFPVYENELILLTIRFRDLNRL